MELTEGDSLECSAYTPMYNPNILPLKWWQIAYLTRGVTIADSNLGSLDLVFLTTSLAAFFTLAFCTPASSQMRWNIAIAYLANKK